MIEQLNKSVASASALRMRWGFWFYLVKTACMSLAAMLCVWQAMTLLAIATPCVTAVLANVFMTFWSLLAIAGAAAAFKCRHRSYIVYTLAKLAHFFTAVMLGTVLGLVSFAYWA